MTESTDAVGVVHGIDDNYIVKWVAADLVQLENTRTEETVYEFASANSGGFISNDDVMDQARDIVAEWDEEDL